MEFTTESDHISEANSRANKNMNSWYGSMSDIAVENEIEEKKISNTQSLMSLLKGYIGTGILAIPSAFKYGGLWVSMIGIFIIGIIATFCVHMLVTCSRYIERRINRKGLDYGSLAGEVFLIGPPQLSPYSRTAKIIVNVFLALTQFGFCTVYIVFMSTNTQKVVEKYAGISWPIQVYQFLLILLLVPYLAITNLRILSFFSGLANLLMVFGLSVILYTCFFDLPSVFSRPPAGSLYSFPLYFGIAIFTFEGIGVVLPLENKMKTPRDFAGYFGVINLGITITTCLIAGIGFFGYLKFGENTEDSITLNLPDTIFYDVIRLLFVATIFFTYGIQFYVPIEFMWHDISLKLESGTFMHKFGEYFLRLFFLILTFAFAAGIPHLDLMISLVGAVASTTVALIIPAILDALVLYQSGYGYLRWKLIRDIAVIAFGLIGLIAGTGVTLHQIIVAFQSPA